MISMITTRSPSFEAPTLPLHMPTIEFKDRPYEHHQKEENVNRKDQVDPLEPSNSAAQK
jgi:hypothetical protein